MIREVSPADEGRYPAVNASAPVINLAEVRIGGLDDLPLQFPRTVSELLELSCCLQSRMLARPSVEIDS